MKNIFIGLILCTGLATGKAWGQNPLAQQTQVELSAGLVVPYLYGGGELKQSQDLRNAGLSYYAAPNGNRASVGSYGNMIGSSLQLSFYKPLRIFKKVHGHMLGATVTNAQTGSEPSSAGYDEAYYFNFITAGLAWKYYPFTRNNFFVKNDFGIAAVLTKNGFKDSIGQQNYFHQFGIGTAMNLGAGYSFTPFKNKHVAIDVQVLYQYITTRVEVNGRGNDQWYFGAIHFMTGLSF